MAAASTDRPSPQVKVSRRTIAVRYYLEPLVFSNQAAKSGDRPPLEIEMIAIPGGKFQMGSPKTERDREESEGPQREVTIEPFFLGKYPITQTQWRAVAEGIGKVEIDLEPDPSNFKGGDRPVKQMSWLQAKEFCARLSQRTGRDYRLPSEAEWEYACRAGTTTPFHFGETITTDLANYRGTDWEEVGWSGSYGDGPKGIARKETTPVGSFKVANDFGLFDMHGNIWEWCEDVWHENFSGAPPGGTPWIEGGTSNSRVLRGGSWNGYPRYCRSASRFRVQPDDQSYIIGFRVACSPARSSSPLRS